MVLLEFLENIDHQVFLFLNGLHVDWLDRPMYILTQTLSSAPWFLFLLFAVYKKAGRSYTLAAVLGVAMVVFLCDMSSVHLFKNVFHRYRPSHHLEIGQMAHLVKGFNGNLYYGGKYGFVSSHAANLFGVATFLWLVLRPVTKTIWFVIFGWAALVTYTRIYLGVHYPSDLAGGMALGAVLGTVVYYFFNKASSRIKSQSAPTKSSPT